MKKKIIQTELKKFRKELECLNRDFEKLGQPEEIKGSFYAASNALYDFINFLSGTLSLDKTKLRREEEELDLYQYYTSVYMKAISNWNDARDKFKKL